MKVNKSKLLVVNSSVNLIGRIKAEQSLKYLGVYFNTKGIDVKKRV